MCSPSDGTRTVLIQAKLSFPEMLILLLLYSPSCSDTLMWGHTLPSPFAHCLCPLPLYKAWGNYFLMSWIEALLLSLYFPVYALSYFYWSHFRILNLKTIFQLPNPSFKALNEQPSLKRTKWWQTWKQKRAISKTFHFNLSFLLPSLQPLKHPPILIIIMQGRKSPELYGRHRWNGDRDEGQNTVR